MKNTPINPKKYSLDFTLDLHNDYTFTHNHSFIRPSNNKTTLDKEVNDYHINNFSFRDNKDWVSGEPADIVALGCSHTFGLGVPEEYSWPSIIKLKTNKTVANLGMTGASAEKIMDSFLFYLDRVGTPKYVLGCFPDHFRYSQIIDGATWLGDKEKMGIFKSKKIITGTRPADYFTGEIHLKDKIIQLPADPRYVIPMEECLSQYISSIYIIEKVCKILNIKFYWGTWMGLTGEIFLKNLFLQKNFCLNKNNFIEDITPKTLSLTTDVPFDEGKCNSTHEMNVEDYEKYQEMWKIASDKSHLGIHWQHHTAESFYEEMNK